MTLDRTIVLDSREQLDIAVGLLTSNWRPMRDAGQTLEMHVHPHVDAKTRAQEKTYHRMLNDIAAQCQHLNRALDRDTWKRLCIDQFKRETLKDPECCARYWSAHQLTMMPSLDGSGMVVLGEQSRRFPKRVASVFIEWLYAWGAGKDVRFTTSQEER